MHAPGNKHFPLFHKIQILCLDWAAAEPTSLGETCRGHLPKGQSPGRAVGRLEVDDLVEDCMGASTHESG